MGFQYFGPIDGHDLPTLVRTLRNLRRNKGPRFLHVVTRKGKGYEPAEGDPCVYHGVTPFDPATGKIDVVKYSSVNDFGNVINPMLVDGQVHGGGRTALDAAHAARALGVEAPIEIIKTMSFELAMTIKRGGMDAESAPETIKMVKELALTCMRPELRWFS